MKKENSAHSFTEGHQLSEEEKNNPLTDNTVKQIAWIAWKGAANAHRMYPENNHTFSSYWDGSKDEFSIFSQKANARIAELENELLDALDLKTGKGSTVLQLLKHRLAEAEKERDELSSLIDNVHSEDEILDAVKSEWKKEFGNLQDGTERDCYFVCGLISQALKNLK